MNKETFKEITNIKTLDLEKHLDPRDIEIKYVLMSDKLTMPFVTNHLEMSWHLTEDEGFPISKEDFQNNNMSGKCVAVCGFSNLDKLEEDITEDFCVDNEVFWIECSELNVSLKEYVFDMEEARNMGLFTYIERCYGITKLEYQAGVIHDIARHMERTPVEFINYFCEIK